MITPTDVEQLHLEFINRARSDPDGELDFLIANPATGTGVQSNITSALSFFGVDMDLLYDQLDGVPSVPPLAWNTALAQSADAHSQAMIDADIQSHQVPGELGLGARITAAGYTGWQQVAENVFAYAQDPLHAHAAFYIDWGYGPGGIQSPAGHRLTMLNGLYREIGIGELAVPASNDIGPNSHTQHFGIRPGTDAFLTGVVIDDGDGDQFYDIGEGLSGVSVTATGSAGTFSTTTWGSGGYSLELPPGSYTVTFSGGELESTVERAVTMADVNVKIDAIAPAATDDGGGDGGGDDGGGGDGDQRIV
ncbi:MAG: carboxypeptidase regulatory-like domain-containing protein, partial [Pseudomonadota bacterium]